MTSSRKSERRDIRGPIGGYTVGMDQGQLYGPFWTALVCLVTNDEASIQPTHIVVVLKVLPEPLGRTHGSRHFVPLIEMNQFHGEEIHFVAGTEFHSALVEVDYKQALVTAHLPILPEGTSGVFYLGMLPKGIKLPKKTKTAAT